MKHATIKPVTVYPPLPILIWLSTALILVALPHTLRLASWVFPLFLGLLIWRYVAVDKPHWLPKRFGLIIIVGFVLAGIFLSYRTLFGRDAGISLLLILCSLKLIEAKARRDLMLICFLSCFLVITTFLHSQTIFKALYMGLTTVVLIATLITVADHNQYLSIKARLRLAGTLFVQALPLMLVLFILFPRIPGPFWSLPKDAHKGLTGLSDHITLGNVSELSLSDEVAFRVKFSGEIPPYAQRYWRGPLLWKTDGYKWTSGYESLVRRDLPFQPLSDPIEYTITLEPHQEQWLFALDLPINVPASIGKLTKDYQILSKTPIYQRIRYTLTSYPVYRALAFNAWQRQLALSLPVNMHPRTQALALQWQAENPDPVYLVQRALQHFSQTFTYSYTPPFLADQADPLDYFMFETHQGFCEHYAVAFTVLMRTAGVPTRIVTGYLGGEVNPFDDYLTIRQRDAHAWTEVWLADQGWVRVDPTAVVAPERLNRNVTEALVTQTGQTTNSSMMQTFWEQIRYGWNAFDNAWNQWVLNYDQTRQKRLLRYLGVDDIDWRGLTIILIVTMGILLMGLGFWLILKPSVKQERVQSLYVQFCKKLARQGLSRYPSEGPLQYATRVTQTRPALATSVQQITNLYIQIRYRNKINYLKDFTLAIRRFRP